MADEWHNLTCMLKESLWLLCWKYMWWARPEAGMLIRGLLGEQVVAKVMGRGWVLRVFWNYSQRICWKIGVHVRKWRNPGDSQIFGLNSWKNGVASYWNEEDLGERSGGQNQSNLRHLYLWIFGVNNWIFVLGGELRLEIRIWESSHVGNWTMRLGESTCLDGEVQELSPEFSSIMKSRWGSGTSKREKWTGRYE